MNRLRSFISPLVALFLVCALLLVSTAPRALADGGDSQGSSTTFSDTGKFGVGLAWAPMDMVQGGSDVFTNTGFVDARYWFNDKFGIDGGIGLGLPQVSPQSSLLVTMNVEPMLVLISRKHSLLYANIDLIPALNTGAELPSALTLSAGLGIESQITDIPNLAWFAQWNPVSINWNFPSGGPSATGVTFMGSLMNIMLGFHYYL
ncbi:MAG: phosphoribosylformylglycinamidine synthase [Leptospirillia bacterium]